MTFIRRLFHRIAPIDGNLRGRRDEIGHRSLGPRGSTAHNYAVWGTYLLLLLTIAACDPPQPTLCDQVRADEQFLVESFDSFVDQENLSQPDIDALVLREIPVELQLVLDDRGNFTITSDHPLRGVLPGTPRDAAEQIGGCWGRVETERPYEEFGDGDIQEVVAEAWRVDLRDEGESETPNSIFSGSMKGVDGVECEVDDRPVVQSLQQSVQSTDANRLQVVIENALAAGRNSDGSLSLDRAATTQTSDLLDEQRSTLFTVEGDFMVTAEEGYNPLDPRIEDMDFWVRFDCPR